MDITTSFNPETRKYTFKVEYQAIDVANIRNMTKKEKEHLLLNHFAQNNLMNEFILCLFEGEN